jgi:hypothetical protein
MTIDFFAVAHLEERPRLEQLCRSLVRSAYLGNNTAVVRVLGKIDLVVDTTDFAVTPHLLLDGFWKMWTTIALTKIAKKGMKWGALTFDQGYTALLLAELCGAADSPVVSPLLTANLVRSFKLNGHATDRWHDTPTPRDLIVVDSWYLAKTSLQMTENLLRDNSAATFVVDYDPAFDVYASFSSFSSRGPLKQIGSDGLIRPASFPAAPTEPVTLVLESPSKV